MDVQTIGAALKRKLGPFPVWVWAILGGAVVYLLRQRGYFSSQLGSDSASALQPSQASATTPQPQVTLQPGESAYDPNTGALVTAPGGGGAGIGDAVTPTGTNDTSSDTAQALEDLAAALSSGETEQGAATNSTKPRTTLLARAKSAVKSGKVGPKEKARLKKEGYTNAQINYHTKRHTALGAPKPRTSTKKEAHKAPTKKTTTKTTKSILTRSVANIRTATGGRTTAKKAATHPASKAVKSRTATSTSKSSIRQRPTVSLTRHTAPVAHPVATHKASKTVVHAAPRPSAPAPRAVRTAPARHVAPPPPPPRKPAPTKKKR